MRRSFFHFVVPDYVGPYGADDSVAQAPYATRIEFARQAAMGVSAAVVLAMGVVLLVPVFPAQGFAVSLGALGLAYGARRLLVDRPGEAAAAVVTCLIAWVVVILGFGLRPSLGLSMAGAAMGHLFYTVLVRRDFSFIGLGVAGSLLGVANASRTTEDRAGAWWGALGWGLGFCLLLPMVMRRRRPDQLVMALADIPSEPLAIVVQAGRILKIMARYSRRARPL